MALKRYDLRVNGVELNTHAFSVDRVVGLSQLSQREVLGITGPRMDGVDPVPGRFASPPQFRISMWVTGDNADGSIPADPYVKLEENLNAVLAAFSSRTGLLLVERQMPNSTVRGCDARLIGAMIPDLPAPGATPVIRCEFVLDVPGVFWSQGALTTAWSAALGSLQPVPHLVSAGCTAPITDAVYRVRGPIVNPRIENQHGDFVQYMGTVAAGSTWTVDAGAFTSKVGSTSVLRNTNQSPNSTYLMELWPGYQVRVTGSGTDANTAWQITADRKFH